MTDPSAATASLSPSDELFIYYLEGRPDAEPMPDGDAFIGNWQEESSTFLFFNRPSETAVTDFMAQQPGMALKDTFRMTYRDWLGETVAPRTIGRLFIAPPWAETPTPDGCRRVILDPGVVFGTGTHPTTRDCLELLQDLFQAEPPARVLDLGTGTGVLALAAAALGSRRVLALDFNGLAAATAWKNVRLNGMDNRVMVCQARAEHFVHLPANLLMANIHFDVMNTLLATRAFFQHEWVLLSGLLRSQAKEVCDILALSPIRIIDHRQNDGVWHTILGRSRH